MGWRAYCRTDPKGAFETLAAADLTARNLELWNDLLAAIAMNRDENKAELRNRIAVDAMARLEGLDPGALRRIATSAVDLLMFGPRRDIANLEDWCDWLWSAVRLQDHDIDFEKSLYESAINRASGRLAQVLLSELDHSRKMASVHEARQRERLNVVADENGAAGVIVRAVLVHDLAFLLLADPHLVQSRLVPRITAATDEGRALRATLAAHSAITPEVTKLLPEAIIQAVIEARPDTGFASQVAAGILRPALASVRGDAPIDGGSGRPMSGARCATRRSRSAREHSTSWSNGSMATKTASRRPGTRWSRRSLTGSGPGAALRRRCTQPRPNGPGRWIRRAISPGPCEAEALFQPICARAGERPPDQGERRPGEVPHQVLDLLWLIFGPTGTGGYDMAEVLDRLIKVDPALEVDRRLQSLEQRTFRFR
jgi:hypothetical protein